MNIKLKMKMKVLVLFFCINCKSSAFAKLDTEWWKNTIIYEIIPYTYMDSDGDGIGDFKGIMSKLDHFVDLGIETIHLTPIQETPFEDMGYDISDYYKLQPCLGTMSDFEELIGEMKKRNMKLIMDLVINHSSARHEWFQKSIDRIEPYTDFYVWKDPKGYHKNTHDPICPNSWWSYFTVSAWKWNNKRNQFYLHQFLEDQPDLNLGNEILKKELKEMVKFWLDKGVAGFRLDATPNYFEAKDFEGGQENQPETLEFIHEFRMFLDMYNEEHGDFERIFIAEAHARNNILKQYYGRKDYPIVHFPYTFILEYIYSPVRAYMLKFRIDQWMAALPDGGVSLWMTQDHDGYRVGSRIVPEYSDLFTILSMMLPGSVGVYYGQEIALLNGFILKHQIKDFSERGIRDPTRLIMQWDDTRNAGFSENITTFLPSNSDYFERNVAFQKETDVSHYNMFQHLSTLRKTNIFKLADFKIETLSTSSVLIMKRLYEDEELTVVINCEITPSRVNLTEVLKYPTNKMTEIVVASVNSGYWKGYRIGYESLDEFYLRPLSGVVLLTT